MIVSAVSLLLAVMVPASQLRQVVASSHALIITSSGSVYGWGRCGNGQLGAVAEGVTGVERPIRLAFAKRVVSVAATPEGSLFAMEDGTVEVLGSGYDGAFAAGDDARFTRFDSHGYGTQKPIVVPNLKDVVQVVAANHTYAALRRDGTVAVWGRNDYGMLGITTPEGSSFVAPAVMDLKGVPKIRSLVSSYAALGAIDMEGQVWTWGSNQGGLLGIGRGGDDVVPTPQQVALPGKVVSCALGTGAGFAVLSDGSVWKWGRNSWGLLAEAKDDDFTLRKPVRMVAISGARKVVTGALGRHALVLKSDGSVLAWGNSDWGQCGTGTKGQSQYAVKKVALTGVDDVWAAGNSSFFLVGSQLYWCGSKLREAHDNIAKPVKFPFALQ